MSFLQSMLYYIVVVYIFVIAFVYLSVIVHELGHLIFGFMTGYRFSSFRLFNLVWYKENGKIKFKTEKSIVAGQCLMMPPNNERKFKFILYNLGGGFLNIISVVILTVVGVSVGFIDGIMIVYIVVAFFIGLLNLLPISFSAPNDGMNVFKALQSKEAKRGMYLMLFVNSELMNGKRYRDFDEEIFVVSETADFKNYFVAYIVLLEAARLYDMGEYDESVEQYNRLDINKLQRYYKNNVNLDLLYYYTVHKPDYEKAKKIYENKTMKPFLKYNIPGISRTLAAYEYFVSGNKEKSMMFLKKAKREIEIYPNSGVRVMEKEYCEELEKLFG